MHRVLFICLCVFVEAMEFLRAGPMQTLVIPIPSMGAGTSKSSRWPFLGKTMSNDLTVSLNFSTDWFQIGKGVRQGCILSPAYLTFMQSTSWEMLGWRTYKLESRLPGEHIKNLRYADDTTFMAESEEELKSFLWRWKRRVKKLAWSPTFRKRRSWHLVPSLHGK